MRTRVDIFIPGALLLAVGCGGSDSGGVIGAPGNGASSGMSGGTSGGAANGGATSGGATNGGATNGGATNGGATNGAGGAASGGTSGGGTGGVDPCTGHGTRVAGGGCYVPCTYDPGLPPRYESATGECTKMGWRCSSFQYCDPNVHCQVDATCTQYAGAGTVCVPTGPLAGECAISCATDADCPQSNGATASPYACRALDTGTTVIHVCRF